MKGHCILFTLPALIFCALLATGCSTLSGAEKNTPGLTDTMTPVQANATFVPVNAGPADTKECSIVARGDEFNVSYTVKKNSSVKNVWLFSTNYALLTRIPAAENTSSSHTLSAGTVTLPAGDYRLVIHLPGDGDSFDIRTNISNTSQEAYGRDGVLLFDLNKVWRKKMTGFEADDILEKEIRKPGMQDTIIGVNFTVQSPIIWISPIADHRPGDVFTINGTTNIAPGNILAITTVKNSFHPGLHVDVTDFSGTAIVQGGECGNHEWSVVANISEKLPVSAVDEWMVVTGSDRFSTYNATLFNLTPLPPKPEITGFSVVRGESFTYTGTVPAPAISPEQSWRRIREDPDYLTKMSVNEVHAWVFGENFVSMTVIPVRSDSTFNVTLNATGTAGLPAGIFRVYFQYPQYRDLFDITVRDETGRVMNQGGDLLFLLADIREARMSGYAAADRFETVLKRSDAKDRYGKITLNVTES